MAASNVLTTTDPQSSQIAELMAASRAPWPVGVMPGVQFSPWDFVIRSIDDLAPFASGGNFVLPTGSFAFAAPIDLGVAQVRLPSTSNCLVKGFGLDKVLTSAGAQATLQIEGVARVETLAVNATGASGVALRVDGTSARLRSSQCVWAALTNGIRSVELNGAAVYNDEQSQLSSPSSSILVTGTGGRLVLTDCDLTHTLSGTLLSGNQTVARFVGCRSTGRAPMTVSSATSALELIGTRLVASGGPSAVTVSAAQRVSVTDGSFNSSGVANVNVTGAADVIDLNGVELDGGGLVVNAGTGGIIMRGCNALGGDALLERVAGNVNDVLMTGCRTNGATTNGVVWDAANMPSRGMLIVGSSFGMAAANAFSGFNETDAGVNVKACDAAGTLLAETPIVP